jgi:Family of unknown function (DUF5677)
MPSEEFKPLLDREDAVERAAPLIEAACPLLHELVNHASLVFRRCTAASDAIGGENEDLAAFNLYRHTIELVDGIEVLFRASCVEAAVPLLRATLEASLSLDYILKEDYTRRSLCWTCTYIHARIAAYQQIDPNTDVGADYTRAVQADDEISSPPRFFDSSLPVAALRRVLDRPMLRPIEAEYQRLKRLLRGKLDWFRLFEGPRNRRELARAVGREREYLNLYGEWSRFSHAADASAYIRPGNEIGETAFLAVRSPHQMPHRAVLAAHAMLHSTRLMIDHFRHGENLSTWYVREVREPWLALSRLHVTTTETEEGV